AISASLKPSEVTLRPWQFDAASELSDCRLARISHTFCDPEAIWSEKVSRCKSLTAAGQADPFRQTVFQPSGGRLTDIGQRPQPASAFRAKCSHLSRCEKCGLSGRT